MSTGRCRRGLQGRRPGARVPGTTDGATALAASWVLPQRRGAGGSGGRAGVRGPAFHRFPPTSPPAEPGPLGFRQPDTRGSGPGRARSAAPSSFCLGAWPQPTPRLGRSLLRVPVWKHRSQVGGPCEHLRAPRHWRQGRGRLGAPRTWDQTTRTSAAVSIQPPGRAALHRGDPQGSFPPAYGLLRARDLTLAFDLRTCACVTLTDPREGDHRGDGVGIEAPSSGLHSCPRGRAPRAPSPP